MGSNKRKSLFIDSLTLSGDVSAQAEENEASVSAQLKKLESEINSIKAKLADLMTKKETLAKRLAELHEDDIIPPPLMDSYPVPVFSNGIEKAQFLLDLFSPRTDVFAKRGRSQSKKGIGYYPVCLSRWDPDICPKQKGKFSCNVCHHMKRKQLEASDILIGNFKNHDPMLLNAIGIYPLKDGNVTRFVAIDLDSASWQEDAHSILKTARKMDIPMLWERSSSGNGAHMWILFSEDVSADKARSLALMIIDKTRENNPALGMESYDRLFPSQDRLTKGGVGNLILLPLVSAAAKNGNTVFLDENGIPIPISDQLSYLSRVHKVTPSELDVFLIRHSRDYLEKESFSLSSEDLNPGWIRKIPKLSASDLKGNLILYLSTGIILDKQVLSKKAQEAFRRLASISNPEYYKYLAQHDGYNGDVSSRIPLFDETDRVLRLPRGLFPVVKTLLDNAGLDYSVEDHRTSEPDINCRLNLNGGLYPKQKDALSAILSSDIGILAAAPGFGKTITSLTIIEKRKERTLIIVPTIALLEQWIKVISGCLEIESKESIRTAKGRIRKAPGRLDGGHNTLSGIIDVVTLQSISARIERGTFGLENQYGFIIVDECHHIAAQKTREVLRNLNPRYVLGLSATPKRADGLEKIVYAECGPVIYRYSSAQLAYDRGISQLFVPHFLDTILTRDFLHKDFNALLNLISSDEVRCETIAQDVEIMYAEEKKILIFTRRKEQNEILAKHLGRHCVPYIVLDGEMGGKRIAETLKTVKESPLPNVLIATDKLLGEGVDIPDLDTIVFASPFMQERIVEQCAGRLLRLSQGKNIVSIHDYVDYRIPMLSSMFSRRVSIYKKLGFITQSDTHAPSHKILYDSDDFICTLLEDIKSAMNEIILSSSFITVSDTTEKIFKSCNEAANHGVKTELRCIDYSEKPEYTYIHRIITRYTMKTVTTEKPRNYIAIDRKIIWYGSLNPLGSVNQQDKYGDTSILRIEDKATSECLIEGDKNLI